MGFYWTIVSYSTNGHHDHAARCRWTFGLSCLVFFDVQVKSTRRLVTLETF
jgi:hypothetical protein